MKKFCINVKKSFDHQGHLQRHVKSDHQNIQYPCEKCDKTFTDQGNLQRHVKSDHQNIQYPCDKCEKSFTDQGNLQRHAKSHNKREIICTVCGTHFWTNAKLAQHEKTNTHTNNVIKKQNNTCTICNESFLKKSNLRIHLKAHCDTKITYSCRMCDVLFDKTTELEQHMQVTHNTFACDICSKSFPSLAAMEEHKGEHNKQTFYCHLCKKICPNKDDLVNHLETHHMACSKCGKTFTRKEYMLRHVDECHADQTFPCEICNKTFVRKDVLQVHKKSREHIERANEKDTRPSKKHRKYMATHKTISRSKTTDNEFKRRENFRDSVREGPIHTCICCHRTGYRDTFKQINFASYKEEVNERKPDFFKTVVDESFQEQFAIKNGNLETDENKKLHSICTTCDGFIKKNDLPPMSYLNGLQLSKEYTKLGELETCLIAKNLIFQKIVKLPRSQWSALQGRTVNVPINDEDILETVDKLRTPTNAGIIPIRLKRKEGYKSSHRQQYVNIENVFKVLQDLKNAGHPDYQFVETFEKYKERCRKDDPEGHLFLFGDDDEDENVTSEADDAKQSSDNDSSDEDDIYEKEEEEHRLKDAVRMWQFDAHNKSTCMTDKFPEMHVKTVGSKKMKPDEGFSIAPGEGKVPKNITTDETWDIGFVPNAHPDGKFGLKHPRKKRLTPSQYFQQRILNIDPRFGENPAYLFAAVAYLEKMQLERNVNIAYRRGTASKTVDGATSYSLNDACSVLDKVKMTPKYAQQGKYEMLGRLDNFGEFRFFFTLSCGDKRMNENFTSILQKNYKITYRIKGGLEKVYVTKIPTEGEAEEAPQPLADFLKENESAHEMIRKNVLLATRNFNQRVRSFIKHIVMARGSDMPVEYYNYKVEFQARGAGHIHGVLWIDMKHDKIMGNKKFKTYDFDEETNSLVEIADLEETFTALKNNSLLEIKSKHDPETLSPEQKMALIKRNTANISAFADTFITCTLKDPSTKDIVQSVNMHQHTKTCTKYGGTNCRFKYPKYPCKKTIISVPAKVIYEDPDEQKDKLKEAKAILEQVTKVLENKDKMIEICEHGEELISNCMVVRNIRQRLQLLIDYISTLKLQSDGKSVSIENKYFDEIHDLQNLINSHGKQSYDKVRQALSELGIKKPYEDINCSGLLNMLPDVDKAECSVNKSAFLKHLSSILGYADNEGSFISDDHLQNVFDDLRGKRIDFLLRAAEVSSYQIYENALMLSSTGYQPHLKRDVDETTVNFYNSEWIKAWNANMDIQLCLDYYAIISYITDYYTKDESGTTEFLKQAAKDNKGEPMKKRLNAIKDTFISHRQIGEAEAIYRLFPNFHLRHSNIKAIFIPTGFKKNQSRFLQKLNDDEDTDDILASLVYVEGEEGTFIEKASLLEKYMRRPFALRDLTYCQFCQRYEALKTLPKKIEEEDFVDGCYRDDIKYASDDEEEEEDNDSNDDQDNDDGRKPRDIDYIVTDKTKDMTTKETDRLEKLPKYFMLNNTLPGEPPYMRRRKQVALRWHKGTKGSHEYLYTENQLYAPFTEEDFDMLESESEKECRERFIAAANDNEPSKVSKVKSQLMPHLESVEEARFMVEESLNKEKETGEDLDAINEQEKDECADIGVEEHPDYGLDPAAFLDSTEDPKKNDNFYRPIKVQDLEELCRQSRMLDNEQRLVLDIVLKYVKDLKKSESNKNRIKPEAPRLMVHGGAGCGKSFLINLLAQWLEYTLRKSGDDATCPYVLKVAPTGSAASQISGQTLHRAFGFPFSNEFLSLSDKIRDEKRAQLKQLKLVIIDEISMVTIY